MVRVNGIAIRNDFGYLGNVEAVKAFKAFEGTLIIFCKLSVLQFLFYFFLFLHFKQFWWIVTRFLNI